jgi:hypothetical protein
MIHENNKNQHFCTVDVAACAYKIGCSRSSFEQFNFVTPVNFVRKQMAVLLYLTGHYSTPSPTRIKATGRQFGRLLLSRPARTRRNSLTVENQVAVTQRLILEQQYVRRRSRPKDAADAIGVRGNTYQAFAFNGVCFSSITGRFDARSAFNPTQCSHSGGRSTSS